MLRTTYFRNDICLKQIFLFKKIRQKNSFKTALTGIKVNTTMKYIHLKNALIFLIILAAVQSRIHHLKLEVGIKNKTILQLRFRIFYKKNSIQDDGREQITISTYGFLKKGFLQVDVKKLEYNPLFKLESIHNSVKKYHSYLSGCIQNFKEQF